MLPRKRPPVGIDLRVLGPVVVLLLALELGWPKRTPVARPNSPGVLVVLQPPKTPLLGLRQVLFWVLKVSLTWLLQRGDMSSGLLGCVEVFVCRCPDVCARVICLAGVIGLSKACAMTGVARENCLDGVGELFVVLTLGRLEVGMGRL
jgi:hypothetical protein